MRILTIAALAALLTLAAGCQDNEARMQNAKLQAELDNLKNKPANDDFAKLLLAQKKDDSTEEIKRTLNSISGDLDSGMKKLQKSQDEAAVAQNKRIDELESKLKKVDELAASLIALKSMIETLESKVKSVDPNQVLDIQKKLLEAESNLRAEQDSRKKAEAELKAEQEKVRNQQAQVEQLQKELAELKGSATVKSNSELRNKISDLEEKLKNAETDRDNVKKQLDDLIEQIRKGNAKVPEKTPEGGTTEKPKDGVYSFEGMITAVAAGKAGAASSVLVNPPQGVEAGNIPPEGAELLVLDGKNQPVCRIKVTTHYYRNNDKTKPIDQLGCVTIDQKIENPVLKNYKAVWQKPEPAKDGGASGK